MKTYRITRIAVIRFCCGLLLWGLPSLLAALDPSLVPTQYILRAWQVEQGLPQNSVEAIAQDRDGFLWLGTQEGLVRFDGVSFKVFDRQNTKELRDNHIRALLAAHDGSLWIGTFSGLIRYLRGRFVSYGQESGLRHLSIQFLFEDHQGRLWVGTEGGGLQRLEGDRFITESWTAPFATFRVRDFIQDRRGNFWIATAGSGLYYWNGSTLGHWARNDGLGTDVLRVLLEDSKGVLWIGTSGAGVRTFDGRRFAPLLGSDLLTRDVVTQLVEDRDGNLWIGAFDGLYRLAGGRMSSLTMREGLPDDQVLALCEDREGGLWMGTSGGGLVCLSTGPIVSYTRQQGLAGDNLNCVYQDRAGIVWIGSDRGGLTRFDGKSFAVLDRRAGLPEVHVTSLLEAPEGGLWVGTAEGLFLHRAGRFSAVDKPVLGKASITVLLYGRDGALWIGTDGDGLFRRRGERLDHWTLKEGLADVAVQCLAEDREGAVWIGTDGKGISLFKDGVFRTIGLQEGLSSGVVMALHVDGEGVLWAGTYGGGLNRGHDGRCEALTSERGLYDDVIFSILEDEGGTFWMSCNKGIFSLERARRDAYFSGRASAVSCRSFGASDGMKTRECNGGTQPAGWRDARGRLWFATIRGAAVLDPRRLKDIGMPRALLDGVIVDRQSWEVGGPGRPAVFPPGTQDFAFYFTAILFAAPERVVFRYYLEGRDHGWVDAGTRRQAYYTDLKPGCYTFRISARAGGGIWTQGKTSFSFTVRPWLYQRPVFWMALLLLLCLGVWTVLRGRVASLRRREKDLAALVEGRTHDLFTVSHQLEEANWRLHNLSLEDPVLGVWNRRYFDTFIKDEWQRSGRMGIPLSLIMSDIDDFKPYNDTYGHLQGDEALKAVARVLTSTLGRSGDLVARYGGEEFAIVLFNTPMAGALQVAERLRTAVEELKLEHSASRAARILTLSLGVATMIPSSESHPDELIGRADAALYRAKGDGRNCVRHYEEG